MSDNINPASFQVVWEGILQETENVNALDDGQIVQEISVDDFFQNFGFHPSLLDDDWEKNTLDAEIDIPEVKSDISLPLNEVEMNEQIPSLNSGDSSTPAGCFISDPASTENSGKPEKGPQFLNLDMDEVNQFIKNQENKHTAKKTLSDIRKFEDFLKLKGEKKEIQNIDVDLLDEYVVNFVLSVKKQDGKDFEPSSLRNIVSSIDRKLRRHKYSHSIMNTSGPQFSLTRSAFAAKSKSLKKCGKGNKPKEAPPLSDDDINQMYQRNILGNKTPKSLLNTLWLNNSIHFGLRGTTEQYNLRWGDITLKMTTTGEEYLELNERQTKTRTGENLTGVRKVTPKMFATTCDRDPVSMYKLYADKRPSGFSGEDDPFYIAPRTTAIKADRDCKWYIKQKLGEKKIRAMLKTMANDAGLGNAANITNHSARKHLIQKLRDCNVPPTEIMQISGHKNVQSILNYSGMSEKNQKKCSNLLSSSNESLLPAHTYAAAEGVSPSNIVDEGVSSSNNNQIVPATESNPTQSHGQQVMSMSTSNSISSKFFGAVFHVQNFNVYN